MSGLAHLGEVHFKKAESALEAGDLDKAKELFEKALNCYEDGSATAAQARSALGSVLAQQGEHAAARSALERAVAELEQHVDHRAALARALNQLGLLVKDMGQADVARQHHERAYQVAAFAEDRRQRAVALRNLAALDRESGDTARAVQRLAESAELHAAEGDRRGVALIHRQVRAIHLQRGDLRRAYEAARRELEAREALASTEPRPKDEVQAFAAALLEAGELARRAGELEAAEKHLARATEVRHQQHDLPGAGKALVALGHVLLASGRPRAARAKLEAARDALGEGGPKPGTDGPSRGETEVRAELWRGFAETDLARLDALDGGSAESSSEPLPDRDTETDDLRDDVGQLRRRARGEAEEAVAFADKATTPAVRSAALRTLGCALAGEEEPGSGDLSSRTREVFRAALEAAEEAGRRKSSELGDPQPLVDTCLAYGRFLARAAQPGMTGVLRTALEYLERAASLADEVRDRGGPAEPALAARLALAEALLVGGLLDRAKAELARVSPVVSGARGSRSEPGSSTTGLEPRTRARLRVRASRLEALVADPPEPAVAASTVLRAADSQASLELLARTQDPELKAELLDLRRLQAIAKQLSAEPDLERQLPFVLDAAIELAGAERGFVILTSGQKGEKGEPEVAFKAARNLERAEVERPDRKVSSTIAREALESGASVVTGDAQGDQRYRGAGSVAEQRLRSVCAVALRARGRVTGALYLDHRYKAGVFGPRIVRTLESLADHVALLLETSRLVRELKARTDDLARERERLASTVESQTLEIQDIRTKLKESRAELSFKYDYSRIVGRARRMKDVFRLLDKVIPSTVPVFIHGESGTGKELVARAIHWNGPRRDGPFVSENFSALSDSLLESELFGHVKGSFTGALDDKKGLFELANGGTIFLDEVGDLSEKMQKDLLRVLEEREVRPIGGRESIPIDVRVVSATHRDLKAMVAQGTFRQDLYYRLNVFSISLPALRERKEDLPLLCERFLEDVANEAKVPPKRLDPGAVKKLLAYDWPGNVRELKNLLERSFLLAKGDVIRPEEIELDPGSASRADDAAADATKTWNDAKESFARRYLKDVLARAGGNISLAARESGMLRQAFQRLLKRHGVDPETFRE